MKGSLKSLDVGCRSFLYSIFLKHVKVKGGYICMSELELQSLPEAQYSHYIDLGWNKKCSVLLLDVKSVFYLAINTYVYEIRSMLRVGRVPRIG